MATDGNDTVVVLTALNLEYDEVRKRLQDLMEYAHPAGTLYEVGRPPAGRGRIVIAMAGEGNTSAAVLAERSIAQFRPRALFFVGVAGGLKDDLSLGDVVVATRVYAYHGGKEQTSGFQARPQAWAIPYRLDQLARRTARGWPVPVHFKPIAAGEVVLNSRHTPLARQIHQHYNDAVAVEMEGAGVAAAAHLNDALPVLVVRGISDLADGAKHAADSGGWQPRAAGNAAGFALAMADAVIAASPPSPAARPAAPPSAAGHPAHSDAAGRLAHPDAAGRLAGSYAAAGRLGSDDASRVPPAAGGAAEAGAIPPAAGASSAVRWRSDLVAPPHGTERAAVEVHLVPAGHVRLEMRRLAALPGDLATLGRSRRLFTAREELDLGQDDRTAWARSVARIGPSGLAVTRDGRRSAWQPLPDDMLGAVLDPADLLDRVEQMLTLLAVIETGAAAPEAVAAAIGVAPAAMLAEGRVRDMPRASASPRLSDAPLRLPPEEAVPLEALRDKPHDVAEELVARLMTAFR